MYLSLSLTRHFARLWPRRGPGIHAGDRPVGRPRILVAGVYVGDKPNTIEHLVGAFGGASLPVEQRWICVRGTPPTPAVAAVTVRSTAEFLPKWSLLGELIGPAPWDEFDFVLFCDDDILVGGPAFLDRFIALQQRYGFALAQPARTWASYTDWPIVRRRLFTRARRTAFVEGGPLVSMDRRFLRLALPFDMASPMGWGYDLVWPKLAEANGLTLGIVDATPVDHSLRPMAALYNMQAEIDRMARYLSTHDHIREKVTLRTFR